MVDIRHTVLIGAEPRDIYEALTTEGGLSSWWTPNAQATAEVGSIAKFPFGVDYVKHMKIVELIQNESVGWLCVAGDQEWLGTVLSFKLVRKDFHSLLVQHPEVKGQIEQCTGQVMTMLLFEQKNWEDYTPTYAECSYTWAIFLRSLKLFCETGRGTPWTAQHGTF